MQQLTSFIVLHCRSSPPQVEVLLGSFNLARSLALQVAGPMILKSAGDINTTMHLRKCQKYTEFNQHQFAKQGPHSEVTQ
eukprot:scaffold205315_cov28-Prasinocladus_malaysianus.AAC.1